MKLKMTDIKHELKMDKYKFNIEIIIKDKKTISVSNDSKKCVSTPKWLLMEIYKTIKAELKIRGIKSLKGK